MTSGSIPHDPRHCNTVWIWGRISMDQAEAAALEAGWQLFLRNQGDIPFAEIVKFVRARAPRLSEGRIRPEFARRFGRSPGAGPGFSGALTSPPRAVAPLASGPPAAPRAP